MFVVILTYEKSFTEVEKYLTEHREFLKQGYAMKLLLASGPQNPRTGGVILARGNDKTKVVEFLEKDPFKINGIASYSIIEFQPVLFADKMEELL